jgi:hypothetical protein
VIRGHVQILFVDGDGADGEDGASCGRGELGEEADKAKNNTRGDEPSMGRHRTGDEVSPP